MEKTTEETKVKRLRNGQTAFIVWPDLNIRDIYKHKYDFGVEFEIIEVKIYSRDLKFNDSWVRDYYFYSYKICFARKEDADRLMPNRDGDPNWDRPYEYNEPSIGETPEEAIKNACAEIEPMVSGYASMFRRLQRISW